jgi:Fe2+ or Zn2+ uptake regulation protein
MDDLVHAGERRLRANNKRLTPQRKVVLTILAEAGGHLDAHDIYERAHRRDDRLSLSTVYRTLGMLKETGVVRELHLEDEHHHYELDGKDIMPVVSQGAASPHSRPGAKPDRQRRPGGECQSPDLDGIRRHPPPPD